jgi:hypothetical protein
VGNDPYPFPSVWSSDATSAEHSPSRIEPQRGQVSENSSKPESNEVCRVFHEDVARSYLANDSGHLHPQSASLAVDACPESCGANVLTGKSACDDVGMSLPRSPVERADVIPDRETLEHAVSLSGEERGSAVGSNFNSADGNVPEELVGENSASSSCKKVHGSEWSLR